MEHCQSALTPENGRDQIFVEFVEYQLLREDGIPQADGLQLRYR